MVKSKGTETRNSVTVRLVVVPNEDEYYRSQEFTFDTLADKLVFDDRRPPPVLKEWESLQEFEQHQNEYEAWVAYHYPHLNDDDNENKYMSRPYLASLSLGPGMCEYDPSTGFSGCTFDDLTKEEKLLYKQMKKLYPMCTLHLLTFLDT